MTKHRWKGSMKAFGIHIDPEKEEQLKWVKIEVENKVKRILKLAKGINGNEDGNMKKKSELMHLIEDFHQQYESLYSEYEDLRGELKKSLNNAEDDDSSTNFLSDSESYFSPEESSNVRNSDDQEPATLDLEDTILKDKLTSSSEVKEKSAEILKDLTVQDEGTEATRQRLSPRGVASLKVEIEALFRQKRELEEQMEWKSNEEIQMKDKISRLESRIVELEDKCKEKDYQSFSREDNEQRYLSRISNLQNEVDSLNLKKGELEERLLSETKERSSKVKGLMEQINSLQQELESVNVQKGELELELGKKSAEMSEFLLQIKNLKNKLRKQVLIEKGRMEEKESLEVQVKDFELEVHSLSRKASDLEEQIMKVNHEAYQSEVEKRMLQGRISELQASLQEKENELSAQQEKFKALENELSVQIESLNENVRSLQNEREILQEELEALLNDKKRYLMELDKEKQESFLCKSQMEKKNAELIDKIANQQKTLLELEDAMIKLNVENEKAQQTRIVEYSKTNFQLVERKIEEMAEELRKQFEDKYRILSRRIRVAEQLHVENKEWYSKIKKMYEEENKDLKERVEKSEHGFRYAKDLSLKANDVLISLDSVALKFEEYTANFLNRISKSSCELKFAKDWAMRKNKALLHVKDDLDCLLSQLDDKEAEILIFREKVWKSENKVRELEKMIKEKEDGMLVLQEEKREAIRQLCVWIDYHRSRSDYYKKMLSEMNLGSRKAS